MHDTTVVLTSCGRQDLLELTIDSFLRFNTAPLDRFIIIEDGPMARNSRLMAKFQDDRFLWLATGQRIGQIRAIDLAYQHVRTPYIFHCEDDWEFYAGGFIELSRTVLEHNDAWLQVYIRALDDIYGHPLFDDTHRAGSATYRVLRHDWDAQFYGLWHGFAFNPGLRRLSDYRRIAPYSHRVAFDPEKPWEAERQLSEQYKTLGYFATILTANDGRGFVRHTGDLRHVGPDAMLPADASPVDE